MTVPLPSLNLSFQKTNSTSNNNDNSNKNVINLNFLGNEIQDNIFSPRPRSVSLSSVKTKSRSISPYPKIKNEDEIEKYDSPTFEEVEIEFKDNLLSFTIDLLLNDIDLIKNISERGNKIILKIEQLKILIAILYLSKEDRQKYNELMDTETGLIVMKNYFCKDCNNPFTSKVKSIIINKSINFFNTAFSVNMTSIFKISLEYVIREQK
jgi:hypothetical protein